MSTSLDVHPSQFEALRKLARDEVSLRALPQSLLISLVVDGSGSLEIRTGREEPLRIDVVTKRGALRAFLSGSASEVAMVADGGLEVQGTPEAVERLLDLLHESVDLVTHHVPDASPRWRALRPRPVETRRREQRGGESARLISQVIERLGPMCRRAELDAATNAAVSADPTTIASNLRSALEIPFAESQDDPREAARDRPDDGGRRRRREAP